MRACSANFTLDVFSAVPVGVRVVLCLWLSSHVEPARTGAF